MPAAVKLAAEEVKRPAVKLTREVIERQKPAAAPFEVRDLTVPGLRLLMQPSGHRSWLFRYTAGGTYRRMTLGHYPAVALADARKAANAARGEVVHGRDPADDKAKARAPENSILAAFKDYDRDYLSWGREYIDHETADDEKPVVTPAVKDKAGNVVEPKIGADTAAATRSFFIRRVLPKWHSRNVGSFTTPDVVQLLKPLEAYKDAHRKGRTRLSHFFKYTKQHNKLIEFNPVADIESTGSETRERVLTADELRIVWNACESLGTFGAFVRALFLTAARRTEVARMDRAELSPTLWSIDGSRTKNGKPHDIHCTAQLNAILEPLLAKSNSPFVFEGRRHDRPLGGFSKLKKHLDKITGEAVAHWTLHDARRTANTMMQGLGIAKEVRDACTNHIGGKTKVDKTYDRFAYAAERVQAFEALAREIDRIVTGADASNVVPLIRPTADALTV